MCDDLYRDDEGVAEMELLLRSMKEAYRPSIALRQRVLDAARQARRDQVRHWRVLQGTVTVACLMLAAVWSRPLAWFGRAGSELMSTTRPGGDAFDDSDTPASSQFSVLGNRPISSRLSDWELVEAVYRNRERNSQIIQHAFTS